MTESTPPRHHQARLTRRAFLCLHPNIKHKEIHIMAIVLEANYAKKLGLPGYSSHQYSVSIRTELTDLSQVEQESSRLYRLLQDAVDQSIQEVGFMPDAHTYGSATNGVASSATNGRRHPHANGNGHANGSANDGGWRCTQKQSDLIQKIVRENGFEKSEVEQIALEMFGAGVRQLDRLQASGLIDELFERSGTPRRNGRTPANGNGAHRGNLPANTRSVGSVPQPALGGVSS